MLRAKSEVRSRESRARMEVLVRDDGDGDDDGDDGDDDRGGDDAGDEMSFVFLVPLSLSVCLVRSLRSVSSFR